MHLAEAARETVSPFLDVKLGILTSPPLGETASKKYSQGPSFPRRDLSNVFSFCSNQTKKKTIR